MEDFTIVLFHLSPFRSQGVFQKDFTVVPKFWLGMTQLSFRLSFFDLTFHVGLEPTSQPGADKGT